MSNEELVRRVSWEGGIYETVDYGIDASVLSDTEVRAAWDALNRAKDNFDFFVETLEDVLYQKGFDLDG